MALESDIKFDTSKFDPASITKATADLNDQLVEIMEREPRWFEVGAEKYRQMRWNGETPLPKPKVLEDGKVSSIPSRENGRDIPTRIFTPTSGDAKGVFMHIHGGGWVLQSEAFQDTLLKFFADAAQLTVVSVGYRLAPENPFPQGPEDCYDAAEWLVDNAKATYGAELQFVGGESAGGHLSAVTFLHLAKARPNFKFRGLLLSYGAYDLSSFLPSVRHFSRPLILDLPIMNGYVDAFLPNTTYEERRDPACSPLYANLPEIAKKQPGGTLPPALFAVGTEDPLLDDTVFMSSKWMMTGAETIVKVYPGAPHGFSLFTPEQMDSSKQFQETAKAFLLDKTG